MKFISQISPGLEERVGNLLSWTSIIIDVNSILRALKLYLELDFSMVYNLLSYTTLLLDVSETYGVMLCVLLFMLSRKVLVSLIYSDAHGDCEITVNNVYNIHTYTKLTLKKASF